MNSKATPLEQDPFAIRRAGGLVALWAETLPKPAINVDAGKKVDGVRYTLKNKPADEIVIGASSFHTMRRTDTEAHRAHYLEQVEHVKAAAEERGLEVTVVESLQTKLAFRRKGPGDVALKVQFPQGAEAEALEALFADMPPQQMAACVKHYAQMPSIGDGVFSVNMLCNPYDTSRVLNKELAARVLAGRLRAHTSERENIEAFAEEHGMTQAVNALRRSGGRELGT